MSLKIQDSFDNESEQYTVHLLGEVDIYTSEELKTRLKEIIEKSNSNLIVNCEGLEFIDSTGLGALIYVFKEAKDKNLEIILRTIKPNIKKLFFLTKLDQVFKIEE